MNQHYPSWILIFDNAGFYSDIENISLKIIDSRLILITTQEYIFFLGDRGIDFTLNDGLDPSEALDLLIILSKTKDEVKEVKFLVKDWITHL